MGLDGELLFTVGRKVENIRLAPSNTYDDSALSVPFVVLFMMLYVVLGVLFDGRVGFGRHQG
jgi:hypothetical protein